VDDLAGRVAAAGHPPVVPPRRTSGQRYVTVADLEGYRVDRYASLPG